MNEFEAYQKVASFFKVLERNSIPYMYGWEESCLILWPNTKRSVWFNNLSEAESFLDGYHYAIAHGKEQESKL